ncbi:DUF2059 domain-containing protein [Pontixanthobacter sp.]|uniref:DUF2059 domain-containing protein n=1 Tax=Pontixanthobacter sp. TaxID=2792078 RepID=UPI003C7E79E9
MIRTLTASIAAVTLTFGPPVAAQTGSETNEAAEVMALLGDMFQADPLTAEQEALLPLALVTVDQVFPEGTYRTLMEETMQPMFDSMFGTMGEWPVATFARIGGLPDDEVAGLGDTTLQEITEIVDPAFGERTRLSGQAAVEMITNLVDQIEPSYRAGLARAYAVRFTRTQLTELNAFFETPTGKYYAGQSMLIYADPQVMAAMNEMMPAMMEMLPAMMAEMETRTAALPAPKTYDDLTADERTRLSELLGVSEGDLEHNMQSNHSVIDTVVEDSADEQTDSGSE